VSWAIQDKSHTQRRACRLVGLEPKTYRYASMRPDDGALQQRLKDLASERRRFGYRRLYLLLRRQGLNVNHKKLYRLYREERLTVRKRGGRKRALGTRAPMTIPQGAQSTLVAGLRLRHPCLGPQVPDADPGR
jgi:putative transposase